jgi:hypothetical protein
MSNNTHYISNGNTVDVSEIENIDTSLPVGIYAVQFNQFTGYKLHRREPLDIPKKIYGLSKFSSRILDTYKKMGKGMGVLLSGPKGTGKTVEAKVTATESGIPVILITTGYADQAFQDFLDRIKTPCVILIDEFEKLYYDEAHRNFFLSIMDGVGKSRHLFILTSNMSNIGTYFSSRPGRVRYHKEYDFLSEELIREIVYDKIANKEKAEIISQQLSILPCLSVDSLVCMLDECNMYDEVPRDFESFFNFKVELPSMYDITFTIPFHKAKSGLSSVENEEASDIIDSVTHNYHYDEERFNALCNTSMREFKAQYSRPFRVGNGQKGSHFRFETVGYSPAQPGETREMSRTLSFESRNVVDHTVSRKGFSMITDTGVTVKAIVNNLSFKGGFGGNDF